MNENVTLSWPFFWNSCSPAARALATRLTRALTMWEIRLGCTIYCRTFEMQSSRRKRRWYLYDTRIINLVYSVNFFFIKLQNYQVFKSVTQQWCVYRHPIYSGPSLRPWTYVGASAGTTPVQAEGQHKLNVTLGTIPCPPLAFCCALDTGTGLLVGTENSTWTGNNAVTMAPPSPMLGDNHAHDMHGGAHQHINACVSGFGRITTAVLMCWCM